MKNHFIFNISEGFIKLSFTDLEMISSIIQKATIKLLKDKNLLHFKNELEKAVDIFNKKKKR